MDFSNCTLYIMVSLKPWQHTVELKTNKIVALRGFQFNNRFKPYYSQMNVFCHHTRLFNFDLTLILSPAWCGLRGKGCVPVPVVRFLFKESARTYRKSNGTSVARQQGVQQEKGVFTGFSKWGMEGVTMVIWHLNVAVRDLGCKDREVNQCQVLQPVN